MKETVDAFNLKLADGQGAFVSHPIRSLAQAYVYYNQCAFNKMVIDGWLCNGVIYDYDIPEYDVWHMMIDASSQSKGYGKEALKKVLEYIKGKPFGDSDRVALTCNKVNTIALKLFQKFGFELTGNYDKDEVELALIL